MLGVWVKLILCITTRLIYQRRRSLASHQAERVFVFLNFGPPEINYSNSKSVSAFIT